MNKINGYTEEEAKSLVEYIWAGKQAGKTLTYLFETYGAQHGRAKGSVRNYYYALMKNPKKDERVVKLLDGKQLSVEQIREFTEEETDKALRSILAEKSKGISVRRAISNIAKGDDKLMLRLQNKYRNILKKQPERIDAIASEMGLGKDTDRNFLQRRLENEINALYDRLTQSLKEENARLSAENSEYYHSSFHLGIFQCFPRRLTQSLKEENARLSAENSRLKRENEALRRRSTFREI